jgi:hypothetical protein
MQSLFIGCKGLEEKQMKKHFSLSSVLAALQFICFGIIYLSKKSKEVPVHALKMTKAEVWLH